MEFINTTLEQIINDLFDVPGGFALGIVGGIGHVVHVHKGQDAVDHPVVALLHRVHGAVQLQIIPDGNAAVGGTF